MAQFREHRGALLESMRTVRTVKSMAELRAICRGLLGAYGSVPSDDQIKMRPYGYDGRIKWHTYIVTVEGYGVVGFTDGPLPEQEETNARTRR
jgi:hypothetical protein